MIKNQWWDNLSMESAEGAEPSAEEMASNPGYVEQPVVALYIPEEDGNPDNLKVKVKGAQIVYNQWQSSNESSQQILLAQAKKDLEKAQKDADAPTVHDDYSLFVITPNTDVHLYDNLGEVDGRRGVLLSQPDDSYGLGMIEALESRVGKAQVYRNKDAAQVGITKALGL